MTRVSLLLWSLGLAVRLTLVFGFHRYELFRPEPVKIAISLAKTGAFADPYAVPTGFTAHAAPFYPALLAPIYYFWGDSQTADFLRIILSIAVAAAGYALLPAVAAALRMRAAVGVLAGAVGALLPAHFWPESMGEFETAWVPLFLEASAILLARLLESRSFNLTSAMLAGIWCGIGALLSPSIVPVLLVFSLFAIGRMPRAWQWGAIAMGAALITIGPWLVRNQARLGGFAFVRDNFGLELYVSNNDYAVAELELNDVSQFYQREHPFSNPEIARELRDRGELSFEHDRLQRALGWIRSNQARFLSLTGARVRNFWFHAMLRPLPRLLLWTLNLGALIGIILLSRENRWAAMVLGSALLTYPAIYYLIENGMRYEHGVYWITLLLAAQFGVETATLTRFRRAYP
jgi:hypothetical protein